MEAKIYNIQGKETGKIELPESVFGLSWNADLVHHVVDVMQDNARTPVAHTKDRSEVAGGGKKPWKQKGTGRARHGSTRSPIWVGGGVTHGPRNEKLFGGKINKKMRAKALFIALSEKFKNGEILFVDDFAVKEPKTKEAKAALSKLSAVKGFEQLLTKKKNSAFIGLGEMKEDAVRSLQNFPNIETDDVKNLSVVDVLKYKTLIITKPEESIKFIEGKLA
jgi:large subunit ribosomal protein L4